MANLFIADELKKLKELVDAGVLTQAEFDIQKDKLLSAGLIEDTESDDTTFNYSDALYRISLTEYPQNQKIPVINALRSLTGLGLADAKKAVESLPHIIVSGVSNDKVQEIRALFATTGAALEIVADAEATENTTVNQMDLTEATSKVASVSQSFNKIKPIPKCPTCGSPDLKKLDSFDGALSFAAWGFGSKKAGKSFQCRNCGYTW